tara:strand:- start:962 stop:1117 length:156 start_codon:yes stop_codon:yes gene_type:complete
MITDSAMPATLSGVQVPLDVVWFVSERVIDIDNQADVTVGQPQYVITYFEI